MYQNGNPAILETDDFEELKNLEIVQEGDEQLVILTFVVDKANKNYASGKLPTGVYLTNGITHRTLPVPAKPPAPAAPTEEPTSAPQDGSEVAPAPSPEETLPPSAAPSTPVTPAAPTDPTAPLPTAPATPDPAVPAPTVDTPPSTTPVSVGGDATTTQPAATKTTKS